MSVKDIDDTFKVEATEASLILLPKVIVLTSDLPSSREILQPFEPVLDAIDQSKYPAHIVIKAMETVSNAIGDMGEKKGRVVRPAKQVAIYTSNSYLSLCTNIYQSGAHASNDGA